VAEQQLQRGSFFWIHAAFSYVVILLIDI
jgi:hypothetical protein